jgi:HAD superfamily hydrolase (TIGR01509 family)
MKKEAVFFDLDDTLIANDTISGALWSKIIDNYCEINSLVQTDILKKAIEVKNKWYWSDMKRNREGRKNFREARRVIIRMVFEELNLPPEDAVEIADKYYLAKMENADLLPGAAGILELFVEKGIKLVLITNGESFTQRFKINRLKLGQYFKNIFIEGELGFGKPDVKVFKMAMEAVGTDKEKIIMVGDKLEWDIRGAAEAGIASVWCDYNKEGLPSGCADKPDHVINDISELPRIVLH